MSVFIFDLRRCFLWTKPTKGGERKSAEATRLHTHICMQSLRSVYDSIAIIVLLVRLHRPGDRLGSLGNFCCDWIEAVRRCLLETGIAYNCHAAVKMHPPLLSMCAYAPVHTVSKTTANTPIWSKGAYLHTVQQCSMTRTTLLGRPGVCSVESMMGVFS